MGEKVKDEGVSSKISIADESSNLSDYQETAITIKGVESSNLCDQESLITIKGAERSNLCDQETAITLKGVESSNLCHQETAITIKGSAERSNLCDQETAITLKGSVESSNLCDQETAITLKGVENCGKRGDLSDDGVVGVGVKDERNVCCVIDVNQRVVCRICHLSKWEIGKDFADLIELGCGCKGELGFAHSCCAESWFKLRGNRICEICSKTATNITGINDYGFMEEWNEGRVIRTGPFSSEERRRRGCLFGQPFCNFLMACIVIAFVMPWFFHVNLY